MRFAIDIVELERLFRATVERLRKSDKVTLSACVTRVFVECRGDIAGIKAPVFCDGAVTLPAKRFRDFLKTYKGMGMLIVAASTDGLHIESIPKPVLNYDPTPKPPADF